MTKFSTFDDLIKYNLKFLNGELQETFYHSGPVDPETVPLLGKLKTINSFGFFSLEGQPSLCDKPKFVSKTWVNNAGEKQGNWWYKAEQKSYICGFIEESDKNENLLKYLLNNDKIYINISRKNGNYFTNFPGKYNVTRESTSTVSQYDGWSKWILHSNIQDKHQFDDFNLQIFKNCLYICISVKNYCKDSVEDVLLDYYNKSPIKPTISSTNTNTNTTTNTITNTTSSYSVKPVKRTTTKRAVKRSTTKRTVKRAVKRSTVKRSTKRAVKRSTKR
jgi:hypothetical protein